MGMYTELNITETSFLPIGVTATVNPDDIKWTSVCTGTCYGRDTFSAEDMRGGTE